MKILITSIIILFFSLNLSSQNVSFQDARFKIALLDNGVDTNNDSEISYTEAEAVTSIFVGGKSVQNLQGIEAFTNLVELRCGSNRIMSLDLSANLKMEKVYANSNEIADVILGENSALRHLDCSGNRLSSIDLSKAPNLDSIKLRYNDLSELDLSNNKSLVNIDVGYNDMNTLILPNLEFLENLEVSRNDITSLNLSEATRLKTLGCETTNITELDLSNNPQLSFLDCSWSQITELDISNNKELKYLNCNNNNFKTLHLQSYLKLEEIYCRGAKIESAIFKDLPSVKTIDCDQNKWTEIEFIDLPSLEFLRCGNRFLKSTKLINLPNLEELDIVTAALNFMEFINLPKLVTIRSFQLISAGVVSDFVTHSIFEDLPSVQTIIVGQDVQSLRLNNLPRLETVILSRVDSLELNNLPMLQTLETEQTKDLVHNGIPNVQSIEISGSLKVFEMNSPLQKLEFLNLSSNDLESIDLSLAPNLTDIDVSMNNLLELDVSEAVFLQTLKCQHNPLLSYLNLTNGYQLNNFDALFSPRISYVCCDPFEVDIIRQGLEPNISQLVKFDPFCLFDRAGEEYSFNGSNLIFSDNDCKTSEAHILMRNRISFDTTEVSFFSNINNNFDIPLFEGAFIITPEIENSEYYKIEPSSVKVDFPEDGDSFTQDFCITPLIEISDLEVAIIPITGATAGFETEYKIIYKNKGTTSLTGTIDFYYQSELMEFLESTPTPDSQPANALSWEYTELKPFEEGEIFITMELNTPMDTPPLVGGEKLIFKATINPVLNDYKSPDNSACLEQDVVNSYDPNDKRCLEGETITDEMIGEYVHYMIRFENLGTAPARRVIVTDEINLSMFDINSLQITDSSHDMVTQVREYNIVDFIFDGINLPFDDDNNDGYVCFKIKTLPTLTLGDSFENEANIYFDFNFPIKTNLATTSIQLPLSNYEIDNSSIDVSFYPNPTSDVVNIESLDKINKVSVYNISGQLLMQSNLTGNQTSTILKLDNLNNGTYIIEVETTEGKALENIIFQK